MAETHQGMTVSPTSPGEPRPVRFAIVGLCLLIWSVAGGGRPAAQGTAERAAREGAAEAQLFVKRYCAGCHNERLRRGGLVLADLDLAEVGTDAALWEKVVTKLRAGQMPPVGARRPDAAAHDRFRRWLAAALDRAAAERPNPGPAAIFHRLNRGEYQNAVRDLLRIDIDAARFLPADDSSHGFDNMAGTLRVSPLLMERYLAAAKAISRLAVGGPVAPDSRIYYVGTEEERRVRAGSLPLGAEGGTGIRHYFPRNGLYDLTVVLERTNRPGARRTAAEEVERHLEITVNGVQVGRFAIDPPRGGPPPSFSVRVPVNAGEHVVAARFHKLPLNLVDGLREPLVNERGEGDIPGASGQVPRLYSLTIEGPFEAGGPGDTPSRGAIFACTPDSAAQELPALARSSPASPGARSAGPERRRTCRRSSFRTPRLAPAAARSRPASSSPFAACWSARSSCSASRPIRNRRGPDRGR